MNYTLLCGDALTQLRTLPSGSVSMCCTSPPYFGLRDYGTATWEGGAAACDHKRDADVGRAVTRSSTLGGGKGNQEEAHSNRIEYRDTCGKCGARRVDQQIGLEARPEEFIDKLVAVFAEVRRVLHSSGQLFLNISDTRSDSREWLGIPHRLVFALQADGWRWEDEVLWAKPNPMPGSQTNRFTRAHEYVFMLNKSRDAFFDGEAVKEPQHGDGRKRGIDSVARAYAKSRNDGGRTRQDNGTRIRRSVWNITTEAYEGSHYATMPSKLVEPMILSGTSAHGCCSACGSPWERVVERGEPVRMGGNAGVSVGHADGPMNRNGKGQWDEGHMPMVRLATTVGWQPTCTCGADVTPAVVLDPFAGSGTVIAVALKFGRSAIGIDLDARNLPLARQRIEQSQPLLLIP